MHAYSTKFVLGVNIDTTHYISMTYVTESLDSVMQVMQVMQLKPRPMHLSARPPLAHARTGSTASRILDMA
jgi:hypothetical protein